MIVTKIGPDRWRTPSMPNGTAKIRYSVNSRTPQVSRPTSGRKRRGLRCDQQPRPPRPRQRPERPRSIGKPALGSPTPRPSHPSVVLSPLASLLVLSPSSPLLTPLPSLLPLPPRGLSFMHVPHGYTEDIDDQACAEVMRRYRLPTKRAAINFALRTLAAEPRLSVAETRALRGIGWRRPRDHAI